MPTLVKVKARVLLMVIPAMLQSSDVPSCPVGCFVYRSNTMINYVNLLL